LSFAGKYKKEQADTAFVVSSADLPPCWNRIRCAIKNVSSETPPNESYFNVRFVRLIKFGTGNGLLVHDKMQFSLERIQLSPRKREKKVEQRKKFFASTLTRN
jgi:hypothetical protein